MRSLLALLLALFFLAPDGEARGKRGRKKYGGKKRRTTTTTFTSRAPNISLLNSPVRRGSISIIGHPERLQKLVNSLGEPMGEDWIMRNDAEKIVRRFEQSSVADRADEICLRKVTVLVAKNPDLLRHKDKDGRTLLHQAAFAGYARTARHLLAQGADPGAKDFGGAKPAELARRAGHEKIAKFIEQFGEAM